MIIIIWPHLVLSEEPGNIRLFFNVGKQIILPNVILPNSIFGHIFPDIFFEYIFFRIHFFGDVLRKIDSMNSDNERFRRIQISRRIAQLNELYNLQHTNLEMENVILEIEEDLLNLLRSFENVEDQSNNQVNSDQVNSDSSSDRSSESSSDSENSDSQSESDSIDSAESNISTESDSEGENLSDYSDDNSSPESYSGSE